MKRPAATNGPVTPCGPRGSAWRSGPATASAQASRPGNKPWPTRHNRASRPAQPGPIRMWAARFAEKAPGLTKTIPQSKFYCSYESWDLQIEP
jgi:hypothetical protein